MEAYFVWALDICTHIINVHEIYGSVCELKCTFGFDLSTFPLTAVTFDWQTFKCLGPPRRRARKGLGNDILTSAIPL